MSIQEVLESRLLEQFSPQFLDVINESHMHNVPKGSESHFKLVIVSDDFAGKSLVMRHKAVYQLLNDQLEGGVHALALHTYTPEEYEKRHGQIPDSPLCRGGNKLKPGVAPE
ncbi:MAG: BolA/IbaG family iron-sulfur metabolism protein [Gammaproteobacteria bacterium]|nr:BolA/IbaG family iron-sulfur metabolism protein [Gammaproteobacteria bacterium]